MVRFLILLLPMLACFQFGEAQSGQLREEISKIIRYETNIDFGIVPGILVGVVDGDSTYVCSFGEAMDKDSIYELGSATKPVVAWLVDMLLDSLSWTDEFSVCKFLPDSLCDEKWESLSIAQVMNHRTGLPRFPLGIGEIEESVSDPYANYDIVRLTKDLHKMHPEAGKYKYSHVSYALMHWLFERVGGLEAYAARNLFSLNGMNHTGWDIDDAQIARGYGMHGKEQPPWHCNAFSPALGLKSSMSDLLTFIKTLSNDSALPAPAWSPALKKELKALTKEGEFKLFQGWFLINAGNYLAFHHSGRTGGHHVSITFSPQTQKGAVVISNGAAGSGDLSLLILDMVMRAKN